MIISKRSKLTLIFALVVLLLMAAVNTPRFLEENTRESLRDSILRTAKIAVPLKDRILGQTITDKLVRLQTTGACQFCNLRNADLRGIDLHDADLRRANLSGASLTGTKLRGANLDGADLTGADLTRANLRRSNLTDADLTRADLTGAKLGGADLRGTKFPVANLSDVNLSGANLRGTILRGANLRGANLTGADLRGADLRETNLPEANLSDVNLSEVNLTGADLKGADLRETNLPGANLREVSLSGADLSGSDLTGAKLGGADLSDSSLNGANLTGADLTGTNLTGADLTGTNLKRGNLIGADLSGVDFREANLTDANLTGTNLSKVILTGTNLKRANLSEVNISGTNLSGLNLSGANLRGVDLTDSNLTGANLSGVDLSGMNLTGTILVQTSLSGANLSGVDLSGMDLTGANLSGVDLSGMNLTGTILVQTSLSGANLSGVDLSGMDLTGANLSGVDLSGMNLTGTDLTRTYLYDAKLVDVDLSRAKLVSTRLSRVDLTGTNLSGVELGGLELRESDWYLGKNLIEIKESRDYSQVTSFDLSRDVHYLTTKSGILYEFKNEEPTIRLNLNDDPDFIVSGHGGLLSVVSNNEFIYISYTSKGDETYGGYLVVDEYSKTFQKVRPIIRIGVSTLGDVGGTLLFDRYGKLYLSVGDGGTPNYAQDLNSLRGKILRFDVSKINPEPEIVAYGLRNAWKISVDSENRMFVGDCGHSKIESVYLLEDLYSTTPYNLGWPVFEGTERRKEDALSFQDTLAPIYEYRHYVGVGSCVIGGFYLDNLKVYLFGDLLSFIRLLKEDKDGKWHEVYFQRVPTDIWSFGYSDETKQLFVSGSSNVSELTIPSEQINLLPQIRLCRTIMPDETINNSGC
jgi:uncharacterized protein YjbI with pentapeptide repeats